MQKMSAYGRKRARMTEWERERHRFCNPAAQACFNNTIEKDIERLRTGAGLHAFVGQDAQAIVNLAGRLAYVVCYAARAAGLGHTPEARIIAGTANALGELAERPADLEQKRASIIAGLEAIDRLLPQVSTMQIAAGEIALNALIERTGYMTTNDMRKLLQDGGTVAA